MNKISKDNEFSVWGVYDSMLQAYRGNMLSSQTLLLTFAAIISKNSEINKIVFAAVCIIGFGQLLFIWFPLIRRRSIIADFHKFNALYNFSERITCKGDLIAKEDNESPITEEIYINNASVRKIANGHLPQLSKINGFNSNLRYARKRLDYVLPVCFAAIWILLFFTN